MNNYVYVGAVGNNIQKLYSLGGEVASILSIWLTEAGPHGVIYLVPSDKIKTFMHAADKVALRAYEMPTERKAIDMINSFL